MGPGGPMGGPMGPMGMMGPGGPGGPMPPMMGKHCSIYFFDNFSLTFYRRKI